jgi:hypothetical protein
LKVRQWKIVPPRAGKGGISTAEKSGGSCIEKREFAGEFWSVTERNSEENRPAVEVLVQRLTEDLRNSLFKGESSSVR